MDAALLQSIILSEYNNDSEGLRSKQSKVDPCVFYINGENQNPEVTVICSVDDSLIIGRLEFAQEIKENLKRKIGTVEDGQLRKLLRVRYE